MSVKSKLKKMAGKCPKGDMIKAVKNVENTRTTKTIDRLNK